VEEGDPEQPTGVSKLAGVTSGKEVGKKKEKNKSVPKNVCDNQNKSFREKQTNTSLQLSLCE